MTKPRDTVIQIRVSRAEKRAIQRAAGGSMSAWLRALAIKAAGAK